MKTKSFLIIGLLLASAGTSTFALTVHQKVTPEYVKRNPDNFSVAVKEAEGMISFTIKNALEAPKYLVAHLTIHDGDRVLVKAHTPLFGKEGQNPFHFSIAAEHLASATFELSESTVNEGVPLPGTIIFQFQLTDFVAEARPDF